MTKRRTLGKTLALAAAGTGTGAAFLSACATGGQAGQAGQSGNGEAARGTAGPGTAGGTVSVPPTPTPAVRAPLTYVALGASDAAGIGVENPQRDSWVAVLATRLPQPTRLVNLGIPGVRLFEAMEVELPPALEAQPHLVTIWLVVNDIIGGVTLDRYRADLDRLLGALRSGTTSRIAIGNVPNAPDSLDYLGLRPVERRAVAEAWNAVIAAAARTHGAVLIDLHRNWPLAEHPEYIGPDRLHPTVTGYRTLAETFHQTLRDEHIV